MTTDPKGAELQELSVEECWLLLATKSIGRFAANRTGQSPLVVPVNYVVDDADQSIVFRSGAGTKLDATGQKLIAIQVDEVDPLHHVGWSVLVEGHARWLYAEQDDTSAVEPWAPGDRPYVIRVNPTRITGRRIRLVQPDTDGRGYR